MESIMLMVERYCIQFGHVQAYCLHHNVIPQVKLPDAGASVVIVGFKYHLE